MNERDESDRRIIDVLDRYARGTEWNPTRAGSTWKEWVATQVAEITEIVESREREQTLALLEALRETLEELETIDELIASGRPVDYTSQSRTDRARAALAAYEAAHALQVAP